MKNAKYVVRKKKPSNNAFDAYKKITTEEPVEEVVLESRPKKEDHGIPKEAKSTLPYHKNDKREETNAERVKVGIVDIEQTAESYENGGVNVLTIRKTDGTTTEFKVRNGYGGGGGGGRGTARPLTVKAIRKAIKADTKNVISGYAYPIVGYGVDPSEKKSYTKFKIAADEEFWKQEQSLVGESVSVVLDYWRPRLGTIISIDREGQDGVATVTVDTYWVEIHYQNDSVDEDGWYVLREGEGVNNWFMLSDHRNMGTVDTTAGALALGDYNEVTQTFAMAVGANNRAHGKADFVSGQNNVSDGYCGFTAGMGNQNSGEESTVFGNENIVSGDRSLASGSNNTVVSKGCLVVGHNNQVNSDQSNISGLSNNASGANNMVSGSRNTVENSTGVIVAGAENSVKNNNSMAVGVSNLVRGDNGIISGEQCRVSKNSVAGGYDSKTYGDNVFVHGKGLKKSLPNSSAVGQFNKDDNTCLFEVGNGTSNTERSNAFEVMKDGTGRLGGRSIATEEEWITIANTTLTEDVASLEFTTDINGNPFECKKIYAVIAANGTFATNVNVKFGRNAEMQVKTYDTYGINLYCEINDEFAFFMATPRKGNSLALTNNGMLLKYDYSVSVYDKFKLAFDNTETVYPSGSLIEVWGLKA